METIIKPGENEIFVIENLVPEEDIRKNKEFFEKLLEDFEILCLEFDGTENLITHIHFIQSLDDLSIPFRIIYLEDGFCVESLLTQTCVNEAELYLNVEDIPLKKLEDYVNSGQAYSYYKIDRNLNIYVYVSIDTFLKQTITKMMGGG